MHGCFDGFLLGKATFGCKLGSIDGSNVGQQLGSMDGCTRG